MIEILLPPLALLLLYLLIPTAWLERFWPDASDESSVDATCSPHIVILPEDAVLKRHFISQLRAELQASLHPRPSDSVLKRHYDALLDTRLKQRLAKIKGLQAC